MDSGGAEVNYCNGTKPSVFADPEEEVDKLEDEEGKSSPLLRPAMNRRLARKRQKTSSRKVQWNDHNGNNLVEVLEFRSRHRVLVYLGMSSVLAGFSKIKNSDFAERIDSSISWDKRGCVCAVM